MTAPATMLPATAATRATACPVSAPGWRLGALYGPAVYGVSAAAVALPDAARHLHTGGLALTWVLTAYAAGVGVGAVTAGRLIDQWGSRPVLFIAATLLAGGALLCVLAPTLAALVTGRVLLAVGSGAVKAIALSGTARLPTAHRPAGLAAFGACLAGFGATAPLAGAMAAHWFWPAALALPVLSVAVIPLCWHLTTRRPRPAPVDWTGAGLLAAVAAGLLLTAQTAAHYTSVLTTLLIAAATAAAAVWLAGRTRKHPGGFLTGQVLSAGWFRHAAAAGACVYAALFAVLYGGPHLLSQYGYSSMQIGVLLLPGAVIGALLARTAAQAARRMPARHVLAAVCLLFAAVLCYTATHPQPWAIAVVSTAAFTASAVAQTLLTAETTRHAPPDMRGAVTGLLTLAIFLGGGCGTVLCVALWQSWGTTIALAATAILPAAGAVAAWRLGIPERRSCSWWATTS
ncbi:MFS transporter [Micromonospora aurantiaca (nom. illeg.)]